jgi:hypothetical protein
MRPGAYDLATLLDEKYLPELVELSLKGNQIGDLGIQSIGRAFKSFTFPKKLKILDLSKNRLQPVRMTRNDRFSPVCSHLFQQIKNNKNGNFKRNTN